MRGGSASSAAATCACTIGCVLTSVLLLCCAAFSFSLRLFRCVPPLLPSVLPPCSAFCSAALLCCLSVCCRAWRFCAQCACVLRAAGSAAVRLAAGRVPRRACWVLPRRSGPWRTHLTLPALPQAPNEAALCYKDKWEEWGQQYGVQVSARVSPPPRCSAPRPSRTRRRCGGPGAQQPAGRRFGLAQRPAAARCLRDRRVLPGGGPTPRLPGLLQPPFTCPAVLPHCATFQVITSTRDTFSDMFDDDQTLM